MICFVSKFYPEFPKSSLKFGIGMTEEVAENVSFLLPFISIVSKLVRKCRKVDHSFVAYALGFQKMFFFSIIKNEKALGISVGKKYNFSGNAYKGCNVITLQEKSERMFTKALVIVHFYVYDKNRGKKKKNIENG